MKTKKERIKNYISYLKKAGYSKGAICWRLYIDFQIPMEKALKLT